LLEIGIWAFVRILLSELKKLVFINIGNPFFSKKILSNISSQDKIDYSLK